MRLSPVSVIHGSLTIDVQTASWFPSRRHSQTAETKTVTETRLSVNDAPAQSIQLQEGANVDELIKGLHAIGATSHDIIAILQAIKAAGGLQADLEVHLMSDISTFRSLSAPVPGVPLTTQADKRHPPLRLDRRHQYQDREVGQRL